MFTDIIQHSFLICGLYYRRVDFVLNKISSHKANRQEMVMNSNWIAEYKEPSWHGFSWRTSLETRDGLSWPTKENLSIRSLINPSLVTLQPLDHWHYLCPVYNGDRAWCHQRTTLPEKNKQDHTKLISLDLLWWPTSMRTGFVMEM